MSNWVKGKAATPPTSEELTCYYKGRIEALDLPRVQVHNAELVADNIVHLEIYGGFNGHGTWDVYCDQIKAIIGSLKKACVVSLNTDVLDDVWTLDINCINQLH